MKVLLLVVAAIAFDVAVVDDDDDVDDVDDDEDDVGSCSLWLLSFLFIYSFIIIIVFNNATLKENFKCLKWVQQIKKGVPLLKSTRIIILHSSIFQQNLMPLMHLNDPW